MRLSAFFLPTLRETPAEAQIASHRLMLRAGMIRQASDGIYSWLPLGFRVLKRIEQICISPVDLICNVLKERSVTVFSYKSNERRLHIQKLPYNKTSKQSICSCNCDHFVL